jgi:hypothetical protein
MTGRLGSLECTAILLETGPFLPAVSSFVLILPFSPGFRRPELAITAVHPQDVLTLFISRSSVPSFRKSKENSSAPLFSIVPKSCCSVSNTIEGCAKAITGKRSIKATKIIFLILIYYNIHVKNENSLIDKTDANDLKLSIHYLLAVS